MIAVQIEGHQNLWALLDGGAELARVHLPASVADEAGALAWWAAHGHELDPDYEAPFVPDPPPEPRIEIFASGLFSFDPSGTVTNIRVPKNLSAWTFGPGLVYCFFSDAPSDADYMVLAYDAGECRAFISEINKSAGGFLVNVVDLSGDPAVPETLNVEVKRAI